MMAGDTVVIDGCRHTYGTIYDNGGPTGNYSNGFVGCVLIEASEGATITIGGNYWTELGADVIDVWDNEELIRSRVSGSGSLSVSCTSGRALLRFTSNGSSNLSGFAFTFTVTGGGNTSMRVNNLATSGITATSATLTWTCSAAGPFHVLCDDPIDDGVTTTANSFVLTELNPSTRHTATVYAEGAGGDRCARGQVEFRTDCGTCRLPLREDFEDIEVDEMPPCWTRSVNFDDTYSLPRVVEWNGNNKVQMLSCGNTAANGHFGMVIAPRVGSDAEVWHVRFKMKTSHSWTRVMVGFCDSTSDEAASFGFTPMETITPSTNDWITYTKTYAVPAGGCRLALRMEQGMQGGVDRIVYIDNLVIEVCGVRNARTQHAGVSSFELMWDTVGTPVVTVRVRPEWGEGDTLWFENASSPMTVTGLEEDMNYEVVLFAECEDEAQVPARTRARTITTEDFMDSLCVVLTQWNASTGNYELAEGWTTMCTGGVMESYESAVKLRNGCFLISPPITEPEGKELMMEYRAGGSTTERLVIGTMTYPDDITTFTALDTINVPNTANYNDTVFRLAAGITDHYIALKGLCYGNSTVNIRALSLNEGHVKGVQAVRVRSREVTLSWNEPSSGKVYIEYYTTIDGPHFLDSVTGTTEAVIGGLTPETLYYFVLYPEGSTACPEVGALNVRTARRDYDLPYCEDFEDFIVNEPYGWTIQNNLYNCPSLSVEYVHSANNSLKLSAATGGYSATIALPEIDGVGGSVISFWATTMSPASSVRVGYYETGSSTLHTIAVLPIRGNAGWRHYHCSVPDSVAGRLALRYELTGCEGIYYVWIDDLMLGSANYADFTLTNLGCTSVDVVWHAAGTTDSLTVTMASSTDTVTVTGARDTIHVGGLVTGRHYDCYVTPNGGCTGYTCSFYTMFCSNGGGGGGNDDGDPSEFGGGGGGVPPQRCNMMDDLLSYELPHGWVFSDSALATLVSDGAGGYVLQMQSPVAAGAWSVVTLPNFAYNALYLRARALSEGVLLAVNGDTVTLDTAWKSYAFPRTVPTKISVSGGSGCWLDDVGQSFCPRLIFSVEGNAVTCQVDDSHNYEYILYMKDNDGNERGQHITTSPFTIEDLQPLTEYDVWWEYMYVDASCVPTFKVATEAIPIPYCINLQDNNNTLPAGWIVTQRDGLDDITLDGTSGLRFTGGNNSWNYLILPQMESADYLQLSLSGSFTGGKLGVGHLSNGTDTSTFVADSVTPHNSMTQTGTYSFGLRNIGLKRIALRYQGYCLTIHRLGISRDPRLSFHVYSPSTLTVQAETDSAYRLGYSDGEYWPNSSIHNITTNPTTVAFNSSDLYVKQFGGLDDCNLHTMIHNPATAPMPFCDNADYDNINYLYTGHPASSYYVGHTYAHQRYCYRLQAGERPSLFVLPYLTNADVSNVKFSFDCKVDNAGSAIEVGVMTDLLDTASFVPVATVVCASTGWHREFVDMSSYTGSGRWIALRAKSPRTNGSFYFNKIRIDACFLPSTTTVHLENYTQVVIEGDADSVANGPFWVEYGPYGINPGQGILVHFDSLPARLNLSPSTEYSIYIYCGNNRSGCSNHYYLVTQDLPLYTPSCTNFENSTPYYMPKGWTAVSGPTLVTNTTSHEGSRSLAIHGIAATPVIDIDTLSKAAVGFWMKAAETGVYLIVGCMSSTSSSNSFHPLKVIVPKQAGVWEYHLVSLADAPANARYIAFRNSSNSASHNLFIDELLITQCTLFDMHIQSLENTAIELAWQRLGNPDATVTVIDSTISSTTHYDLSLLTENTLTIPIAPQHKYRIVTTSSCDAEGMPCAVPYNNTINIVVPADGYGCVDPSDIQSPQAVFFSGTYSNPYSNPGPVDFGPQQAASRHTINYDTSARDPRTGGLLRTIPEGYSSSVRLGNWQTSSAAPEAEGVIYSFLVDTLDFTLLLMHYAAVLQDPMHAPEDQPRFRLELLDTNYNLIDPDCAAADFIANRNLGWNMAADNVLWKDWTTVGVDLTAYHGQQVFLRLTTYDCNEGSHYGYAYFTLECMPKNITAENCGDVPDNIFTAPTGFNYRWYTTTDNTTLSTEQTLITPTRQNTTYLCDLSFIGNPNCSFTLSAFGGTRLPLARFDTLVSYGNCCINVQFVNHSTVSSDGINPVATGESAESSHWDFGNGMSSDNYHGYTTYNHPGTYYVTLIAGISGGECKDTLVVPLTVDFPVRAVIQGPDTLCYGVRDTLRLYNATSSSPLWHLHDGIPSLPLSPDNYLPGANLFTVAVTDIYGCSDTVGHALHINNTYTRNDSLRLCTPQLPFSYGDTVFLPGTTVADYHLYRQSIAGCDSSFHLHLQTSPITEYTVFDTVEASICDNKSYTFFGNEYTEAGEYMVNHIDSLGRCDSLHSLMLDVRPTSATDTIAHACDQFTWYEHFYQNDTSDSRTATNRFLCDSTITLRLFIHPTYDVTDSIVVCFNQHYLYEGVDYGGPIAFDSPHLSRHDCDSMVHVTLYPSNPRFPAPPVVSLDSTEWYPYDTLLLGCAPQRLYLRETSISVLREWTLWSTADTTFDTIHSPLPTALCQLPTGLYGFQLISTSDEGCRDTVRNDSLLWVFPSPEANFFWSPDRLSMHYPEAQFYNQSAPDSCTYLWLFPHDADGSGHDTSTAVNPYYAWELPVEPGEYPVALVAYWLHHGPDTLTVVCTDTATLPVAIVNTYLQFPNSVTPNGDGINDLWIVVNLLEMGEYSMNELWIYDRFGALVYHVENIHQLSDFWDPNQTNSPDGTYYYRFSAKNNFGLVKRNGVIEVSR